MKARRQCLPFGAVLALSTVWFTLASSITIANAQGGTSLETSVNVVGLFEIIEFDWVTAIEAVPTELTLTPTSPSGTINYTYTATREEVARTDIGVSGTVVVTNVGDSPTQGLIILIAIEARIRSEWETIAFTPVDTRDTPVLDPGETGTYSWTVNFTPVDTTYRAVARVSITNHPPALGRLYVFKTRESFIVPDAPERIGVDETATVRFAHDDLSGLGFTVVSDIPRELVFSEASNRATFSTTVTSTTATAGTYTLRTTATLTEADSRQEQRSSVGVTVVIPPASRTRTVVCAPRTTGSGTDLQALSR